MNGKNALGVLLVIVGSIAVLNFIGIKFGAIINLLLPFILIGLGILGWANNKKWIGGILIVIGSIMVLGKLGGLIMLALAIGLIVVGIGMFKSSNRRSY